MIQIKNYIGQNKDCRLYKQKNWLDYWINSRDYEDNDKQICFAFDNINSNKEVFKCNKKPLSLDGGVVTKIDGNEKELYILPVCDFHKYTEVEYWTMEPFLVRVPKQIIFSV
jgi:hypothetical protein